MTGKRKLSNEVIQEICARYEASEDKNGIALFKRLASEYDVSWQTIQLYVGRSYWRTPDALFLRRIARYGITLDCVIEKFIAQAECCAVCKNPFVTIFDVVVEHDNECCRLPGPIACGKCFRGLTCHRCNLGLGYFLHDPRILRDAAIYMDQFREGDSGVD